MADLDPESLTKLRVVDLREQLSSRGLSTSGLKAELIKRLREAILNDDQDGGMSDQVKQSLHEDSEGDMSSSEIADKDQNSNEDSNDVKADRMDVDEMDGREMNREEEEMKEVNKTNDERFENEEELIKTQRRLEKEHKLRIEQEQLKVEKEEQLRHEEEERLRCEEVERLKQKEEESLRHQEEERSRHREAERLRRKEEEQLKSQEEERLKIEQKERLRIEKETQSRIEREKQLRLQKEEQLKFEREKQSRMQKEEQLRIEREKQLRMEREEQLRKEKERLRREEEEKTRLRIEEEKKAEEKWLRIERQRKAEAERLRMDEEERIQIEAEKKANEQLRIAEEKKFRADRLRREAEMTAEEEQSRIQSERIAERERVIAEEEKYRVQTEKEMLKAANQRNKEDRRRVEEELKKTDRERARLFEERRLKKISKSKKVDEELLRAEENWKIMEEEGQIYDDAEENMDTNETPTDIKLPQALEKVLALKTERAQLLGVDPDSVVQPDSTNEEKSTNAKASVVSLVTLDEDDFVDEESVSNKNKDSRNKRRKKKKKKKNTERMDSKKDVSKRSESSINKGKNIDIDIEYVQEVMDISDPLYFQFMKIFERFKLTDYEKEKEEMLANAAKDASKEETMISMALRKKAMDLDDDDDDDGDEDEKKDDEDKPKLSKRKLKKLSRMTVAELKQKVNRPELVEMHDVTAKDPVLLLHLKASRNTVPVPRHWCFKRKYLQGKRGIEKPAFELPDFIKRTGIMEMRQALQEKEDQKTMKAKMRERVRPKLGKIDIDYQKLHDAFFKWQTKPRMTIHGDLYYEGKEFETRLKEKKPGDLSDDLRTALGMPTGPNANKCPPPWLIAMQRYGPPPSYPNLKIPGLNAPIPDSCSFGYHAGGWGKPPVDETGRPLYGDVFGTQVTDNQPHIQEEEIDHTLWGELESESSEEEEEDEDEEEEEEEEKAEDESGLVTPAEGLITPSGFSSIPAGMETPDMIELRKRKIESEMEGGETPALYTILPEKKTERVGAAMMGSTHIYDLAGAIPGSKLKMPGTASVPPQGIEVALDPSELEMDTAAMAARYEQTMREQQSQLEKEDLSDMVAEHAARQKNKRKKQQMDSAKPPKKYKEFKF